LLIVINLRFALDQHTSDARLGSLKAEKRLLEWQAADRIRSHIIGGKLRAGARLLEMQLSEQLEVSRGTVRSALALLSREGLVQKVAFTRWQVSDTSITDAWELYTLRGPLEGLAARLAAANVSEPAGVALRALGSQLACAVEEKRFSDVTSCPTAPLPHGAVRLSAQGLRGACARA
jgi:DNA-binding GntR family transcriptional regulator